MGFDLLNLIFLLEKSFSIKVQRGDEFQLLRGNPLDQLTAGTIYDYVTERLRDRWPVPPATYFEVDQHCFVCGYNLRGLSPDGACPECGNALEFDSYVWRGVCHALERWAGAEPEKIRRGTKLVHDLGAIL
jgi:hypothetical protein